MAEQILELFPVNEPPARAIEGVKEVQGIHALKHIQRNLIFQTPKPVEKNESSKIKRPGKSYRKYRKVEDLPENAKAFYERAGKFTLCLRVSYILANVQQPKMLEFLWRCLLEG